MMSLRRILLLCGGLVVGGTAFGHHSFAMFDLDKEVTLEGSVKELQWGNPHVWLQVFVPDANGAAVEWSFEMGAPGMLARTGWKSSTLKANDKVTVIMNPLKDGGHSGRLVRVTLPDGRVLGPGGPPPPPPAKPAA
jgi:hypothetical protein